MIEAVKGYTSTSSELTVLKKTVGKLTEKLEQLDRKQRKHRWQNAVRCGKR